MPTVAYIAVLTMMHISHATTKRQWEIPYIIITGITEVPPQEVLVVLQLPSDDWHNPAAKVLYLLLNTVKASQSLSLSQ